MGNKERPFVQLKDKDFKNIFVFNYGKSERLGFLCDYEKAIRGKIYCFEYENSSRGLTSNLIKILRKNKKNEVFVMFIRSLKHETSHKNDFKNFEYIINNLLPYNVKVFLKNGSSLSLKKEITDYFL